MPHQTMWPAVFSSHARLGELYSLYEITSFRTMLFIQCHSMRRLSANICLLSLFAASKMSNGDEQKSM